MAESAVALLTFPCRFPIKVMGAHAEGFVAAIAHVARAFDPGFEEASIEVRPSRNGRYLGLTLTVQVHSRAQLDELYRTLTTHPMVSVVL